MISLIVCSVNPALVEQLRANVIETIGVPHELIVIDNRNTGDGICKAYNKGGKMAKYPVLCFLHEDVRFETKHWGSKIIAHLNNPDIGMVGFAGGDAKPLVPASWSSCFRSNQINIIQHFKLPGKSAERLLVTDIEPPTISRPVVALDGLFLATKKKIFESFPFDEHLLTGFHGYDIDFSLQVGRHYKMLVVFDIVVHHLSDGSLNTDWVDSQIILSKKWKKNLPVFAEPVNNNQEVFYHWKSFQIFMENLLRLGDPRLFILKNFVQFSFNRYFQLRRFLSLGKYVISSWIDPTHITQSKRH
jgi:hypothetical protein